MVLFSLLFTIVSSAFASGGTDSDVNARIDYLNSLVERAEVIDSNGDGKTDIWNHFVGKNKRLAKREYDKDFDGRVDLTEFFHSGGALHKRFIDRNNDGLVDQWEFPRNNHGLIYLIRMDDNFDGKVDKVIRRYQFKNRGVVTFFHADLDFDGSMEYSGLTDPTPADSAPAAEGDEAQSNSGAGDSDSAPKSTTN